MNVIKRSTLKKIETCCCKLLVSTLLKTAASRNPNQGVHLVYLTLHVGLGDTLDLSLLTILVGNEMHSEFPYQLSEEAAATPSLC